MHPHALRHKSFLCRLDDLLWAEEVTGKVGYQSSERVLKWILARHLTNSRQTPSCSTSSFLLPLEMEDSFCSSRYRFMMPTVSFSDHLTAWSSKIRSRMVEFEAAETEGGGWLLLGDLISMGRNDALSFNDDRIVRKRFERVHWKWVKEGWFVREWLFLGN